MRGPRHHVRVPALRGGGSHSDVSAQCLAKMPCGGRKAGRRRPWPRGTEGCCPRPGPAWCGSARPAAGREGRAAARGARRDPRTSPGRQLQPLVLASVSLCYTEPVCRAKGTKLLCVTQGNGNSVAGGGRWGAGPFEGPGHGSCESTVSVQRGPPHPQPPAGWTPPRKNLSSSIKRVFRGAFPGPGGPGSILASQVFS